MDQLGLRGSAQTRIDDKGRLKIPASFRTAIQDVHGPDVYLTSFSGASVRIYPMAQWIALEAKLAQAPPNLPSLQKLLDRVAYYGQASELDGQGRVVVSQLLRDAASIVGDVRVFGKLNFLEVWNEERFAQKLANDPWTDEDAVKLSAYGI